MLHVYFRASRLVSLGLNWAGRRYWAIKRKRKQTKTNVACITRFSLYPYKVAEMLRYWWKALKSAQLQFSFFLILLDHMNMSVFDKLYLPQTHNELIWMSHSPTDHSTSQFLTLTMSTPRPNRHKRKRKRRNAAPSFLNENPAPRQW